MLESVVRCPWRPSISLRPRHRAFSIIKDVIIISLFLWNKVFSTHTVVVSRSVGRLSEKVFIVMSFAALWVNFPSALCPLKGTIKNYSSQRKFIFTVIRLENFLVSFLNGFDVHHDVHPFISSPPSHPCLCCYHCAERVWGQDIYVTNKRNRG